MAKINTYPTVTPETTDILLGTDVSDTSNDPSGETAGFPISAIPTVLPSYTAAQIADVSNAVNTTDKVIGKSVWDTTNNRVMVASSTAAAGDWYIADGSASVTPA